MKNLVDKAILSYGKKHDIERVLPEYEKIDEIPFDYTRKIMSVIVKDNNNYRMLTKGALEEIIKRCTKVKIENNENEITEEIIRNVTQKAIELAEEGMQVIAIA